MSVSASKKAQIEALLFATRGLTVDELVKRIGIPRSEVKALLEELEMEHLNDEKGIHVIQEGDVWKMNIKPELTIHVRDILPPEMPKALSKTLAIIAAKKPIKQSVVVRIRGNKAYDHIQKLLKAGLITAERQGNTSILDLTEKFFEYFQVKDNDFKEKFKLGEEEENAVNEAEAEVAKEESAENNHQK